MLSKIADTSEIIQCFRQVHEQWPHHSDQEQHLTLRLASIQHLRATWIVTLEAREVVCSLGAYPVDLTGPGGCRQGVVIAAVFTPASHRRRGFAANLIAWTLAHFSQQGVQDFLLFSDIGESYYRKLGFIGLSSYQWQWDIDHSQDQGAQVLEPVAVVPLDPGLVGCTFGLGRSTGAARWVQAKQMQPLHLARELKSPDQGSQGWILAQVFQGSYSFLESNLEQGAEHWPRFKQLISSHASYLGCHRVEGWWTAPALQPDLIVQPEVRRRSQELLMWTSTQGESDPWRKTIAKEGFRVFRSEHV